MKLFFEKARRINMLIYLLEKKVSHVTDLQRNVGGSLSTIEEALAEFEKMGLVESQILGKTRVIWLTHRGKILSSKLHQAIELVEGP